MTEPIARTRRCQGCGEPEVRLASRKSIRLGLEELSYACATCGRSWKTFNPLGQVIWWLLFALINGAFIAGALAGKIREGDGAMLVLGLATLDGLLAVLGVRALVNQLRNPPVEA